MNNIHHQNNAVNVIVIGSKDVDKTAIIRQMTKSLKYILEYNLIFKEYRAEHKGDVLFMSSPHEDGFIDWSRHIIAQKGDIFILIFKTTSDSDSFIEAGMLLEYLTPHHKDRVILVGDNTAVSPEKRVDCWKSMEKKTRRHFAIGVRYIEVSCEQPESVEYMGRRILLINNRFLNKVTLTKILSELFRTKCSKKVASGKMYLAAKLPYTILYWSTT